MLKRALCWTVRGRGDVHSGRVHSWEQVQWGCVFTALDVHQQALLEAERPRRALLFMILFVAPQLAECFCYLGGTGGTYDPAD